MRKVGGERGKEFGERGEEQGGEEQVSEIQIRPKKSFIILIRCELSLVKQVR